MADDNITVEIEPTVALGDSAQTTTVETDKKTPDQEALADLQSQYDTLKADSERERTEKAAALQRANDEAAARQRAEQERDATRSEVTESRLDTVEQGLTAAKNEADAAEAAYVDAQEKGDWKKAGEAQRRMARAEARVQTLEVAKADLEIAKAQPPVQRQQDQRTQEQTRRTADPVEEFINNRDPETQKWLRAHPDDARVLATDPTSRRAAKINAADQDAVAEGLTRGTTAYFTHVEKFLGMQQAQQQTKQPQRQRSQSAPVAPVQNGGGGMNGGGTTVTLSAAEAKAATDGTLVWNYDDPSPQKRFRKGEPIGTQEFARRKLAMKQEGRYDRMNYEQ